MHNHKLNRIGILLFLLLISLARTAVAADLSITVSPTQVKVGDTVTATVYVNSGGEAVNNIEASISVPSDTLEIQSVTQSGSILTLWVEQPSFGNSTVTLNGGIANPGYSGTNGKIVTFYMKALKAGSPQISFKSGSVRANDGLGTDVTKSKSGAGMTIVSGVVAPVIPETPVQTTSLPVPTIQSSPSSSQPSKPTTQSGSNKTDEDQEMWDDDVENPEVSIFEYKTLDSGITVVEFSVRDGSSGVKRIVLRTPGESDIVIDSVPDDENIQIAFPKSYSGTKTITIEVVDRAGNLSMAQVVIDFPVRETIKDDSLEQNTFGFRIHNTFEIFLNKLFDVLNVVSRLDPLTVFVCGLFILISLGLYKAFLIYQYRKRYKNLLLIRKDVNMIMSRVRRNMKKVTRAIIADKDIKSITEAEDILAESIMEDAKDMVKVLKAKADMRKRDRNSRE